MNQEIFWNAFGAIGTTLGSIITAIAVIIAVAQYRQPLRKKLLINVGTAFPVFDGFLGDDFYSISIANTGVRPIVVQNLYLNAGKKNIVVNNLLVSIGYGSSRIDFPAEIQPEECMNLYISYKNLAESFRDLLEYNKIKPNQLIKILIMDTTSGKYYYNLKQKAKEIANYKPSI